MRSCRGIAGPGSGPALVDDDDLIHAAVGRKFEGDDPAESARPKDRGLHALVEAAGAP